MRNGMLNFALVLSLLAAGAMPARAAGSEDDFKAAYAAADAANKEAGKLRVEGKDYVVQEADVLLFRTSA